MKIRTGFVSNSSSSSFILKRDNLTTLQIYELQNYREVAERWNRSNCRGHHLGSPDDYPWNIEFEDDYIRFSTEMDNFDMEFLLTEVMGINRDDISYEDTTGY